LKSITRDVDQYKSELQTSLSKAKDSVQDVNAALAEAREEIGKVTIASQARRFDDEANNHRATAGSWVVASVVVAVATAAFALFSHRVFAAVGIVPASDHDLQVLSTKAIVLVAMLYLLHFCGRAYVAAKHNETVNRHRANALSTYRLLTESLSDQHNRDLVLAAAAGAIFAPQESGFLKHSTENDLTRTLLDRVSKPFRAGEAGSGPT